MTTERERGAIAVIQNTRGGAYPCTVKRGYIEEPPARAHIPRRIQEQRRRAMYRQRVAFALAVLIVAALLAAYMPWSGTADKPEDGAFRIEAGAYEEEHTPAALLTASSGTEYTPDATEVEALAKLIYGEAGIVSSTTEQAAVVWCVLNRVDDPRFPDTVLDVITARAQFVGYRASNPVREEFKTLAADVLKRYHAEKNGETNVGRVLPAEYCFFTGDGRHNYFTIGWKDTSTWGWTLESPYDD